MVNGHVYHVISRSIAKFEVFNDTQDYDRIVELMDFYQFTDFIFKYSNFLRLTVGAQAKLIQNIKKTSSSLVQIIVYCVMPTHVHIVLKQLKKNGISKYMARVLNGYTRYFNIKHHRKGPLWDGRFRSILVSADEQLLHLTRYIHLNPVSAGIVATPNLWLYSSFNEYIGKSTNSRCNYESIIEFNPAKYRKFVLDRASYQKELSKIKRIILEDYTG